MSLNNDRINIDNNNSEEVRLVCRNCSHDRKKKKFNTQGQH